MSQLIQAMKNDFGGHDNHHYDNVDAYVFRAALRKPCRLAQRAAQAKVDHALGVCETIAGHEDYFFGCLVAAGL